MTACVYTSLMGHYFDRVPPVVGQGVPCVCFTDDPRLAAPGWDVRVVERPEATPRLKAKWFKLNPHECLPEYDVSIWIDAGWAIHSLWFAREALAYLNGCPAVFYPHRWHQTIQQELAASVHPKMRDYPLGQQVRSYLEAGMPADMPILECTSLVRRHHDPAVVDLDVCWWEENLKWSECDQLSLPYVLWKTQAPYSLFPFNLSGQPWFRLVNWRAD